MAISKRKKAKKCGNKVSYPTIEAAKKGAAIFGNKKKIVTILKAYGCCCGGFHFGRTRNIDWSKI